MRAAGWLGAMAGRMFLILLVGIVAAAALAFTVADVERRAEEARGRDQRLVDRAAEVVGLLQRAPPSLWPDLFGPGPDAPRLAAASGVGEPVDTALTGALAARLGPPAHAEVTDPAPPACGPAPPRRPEGAPDGPSSAPPTPPPPDAGAAAPPGPPRPPAPACRRIAVTLAGGTRAAFILPAPPHPPRPERGPVTPVFLLVAALGAAVLAYGVAQAATAPLRRLARAAAELGRDLDRPALAVEGPSEVRAAAAAFNAMQVRLKRHLAERTYMLAAITHDLQTPVTRLRLRLEKVADPQLRAQLLADQAAMMQLVRDGLDLARATADEEPLQQLNLDSLLESLCEDAVEAGGEVMVTGRCGLTLPTRPSALKRCVANLLDNALKYAGAADLCAERTEGGVVIHVLDRGPGIAVDLMQAVTEPFVRLESSRSRETGGVGLGLTIARLLAERVGGALELNARPGGGLDAAVRLPAESGLGPRGRSQPRSPAGFHKTDASVTLGGGAPV